jgi:HIRAN domain
MTWRLPSPFTAKVVGVSFTAHYPENLHRLGRLLEVSESQGVEGVTAVIVRNPDNEHDYNACEVHVPALGEWAMIGHLPALMAARLAPELDDGGTWQGQVVEVLVHPDHDDRPGITIHLQRIEEEQ